LQTASQCKPQEADYIKFRTNQGCINVYLKAELREWGSERLSYSQCLYQDNSKSLGPSLYDYAQGKSRFRIS
jgi:hypothetical protein